MKDFLYFVHAFGFTHRTKVHIVFYRCRGSCVLPQTTAHVLHRKYLAFERYMSMILGINIPRIALDSHVIV